MKRRERELKPKKKKLHNVIAHHALINAQPDPKHHSAPSRYLPQFIYWV